MVTRLAIKMIFKSQENVNYSRYAITKTMTYNRVYGFNWINVPVMV